MSMKDANCSVAKKPRVILLMQFYDPEPIYKGQGFAEAVRDLGYDVEVVTGFPNYPGGKIYDGYKLSLIARSELNGIAITRLPLYPSHDSNKLGRVMNYLSFFFSACLYLTFFAKRANLVYAYSPPVTVGLAAAVGGGILSTHVVLDIHDLWPDTLPATGMISNPRALRFVDIACNWLYRRAKHIVLHSEGFRQILIGRNVPAQKMTAVIGWTDETISATAKPDKAPKAMAHLAGTKILFAGNIGPAQALDAVLDAAHLLQQAGQADRISFCLLGGGVALPGLKEKAQSLELENVAFLPRVPLSEVGAFLKSADCLLVHLRDDPLFAVTMPSKTQAYLVAGKPVIMAVKGEAAALIETAGAGVIATPQNPESIARAALAVDEMTESERIALGKAGQDYYWRELSMRKGMERFAQVFEASRRP